jgi:hypothetical protein
MGCDVERNGKQQELSEVKQKSQDHGSDMASIRDKILHFACGAHDFELVQDDFDEQRGWEATFGVEFKNNPRTERLFASAILGEQHARFWLELSCARESWKTDHDRILRRASDFDVAICPLDDVQDSDELRLRLLTRAWVPGFGQRIFGLTLSNLMACKAAVRTITDGSQDSIES